MVKEATGIEGDGPGVTSATESTVVRAPVWIPEIRSVDPEEVTERMAGRLDKANSLDELFDALTGTTSDELVGRSFEFTSVAWQPYESQRGPIPLAVCEATDLATGEVMEFATTAKMLTRFLRRAELIGAFPFRARITGKKTTSGQTALNFERI